MWPRAPRPGLGAKRAMGAGSVTNRVIGTNGLTPSFTSPKLVRADECARPYTDMYFRVLSVT
jgi:hypothetical protein